MTRLVLTVVSVAVLVRGQGRPVAVVGSCSPEAVQTLSLPCTAEEPCPLFLELAAATQIGSRILLTGNIHTGSATIESVLLLSDDGGHNWTESHARIPSAVLDQIQFFDVETGWINGHVLLNVPRDAFFLLTTDGGKTWRKRPVTSESRTGAVEQFWFDSRTSGRMALDRVRSAEDGLRYELWESRTGGDSWSVRQVDSRPVPFRKPAGEAAVLRLTTNAPTSTYRLERREGERWAPIISFAVSAGQCKPEALAAVEAPPPPEPPRQPEPEPAKTPRKPPSLKKP